MSSGNYRQEPGLFLSIDYDLVGSESLLTDLGAQSIQWISMDMKKKGTMVKGLSSYKRLSILPLLITHSMKDRMSGHELSKHWFKSP